MEKCGHFWMLDHKKYFNNKWIAMMEKSEIIFPAKCHICKIEQEFNKEEWTKRLQEF